MSKLLLLLPLLLTACSAPHPYRGGTALTTPDPSGALAQSLVQSDNPSQPSRQSQHTIRTRTWSASPPTLPSDGRGATGEGSAMREGSPPTLPSDPRAGWPVSVSPLPSDGRGARGEGSFPALPSHGRGASPQGSPSPLALDGTPPDFSPQPAPNTPLLHHSTTPILLSERIESDATTELGAAQKDTSRDLAAKLASLKPITWAGLVFFLFGLASLFWPPLKLLVASVTTSLALTVAGLALIILPTLLVGHELPILLAVTLISAAWFLAHRHGHLRGQLDRSAAVPAAGTPKRNSPSM